MFLVKGKCSLGWHILLKNYSRNQCDGWMCEVDFTSDSTASSTSLISFMSISSSLWARSCLMKIFMLIVVRSNTSTNELSKTYYYWYPSRKFNWKFPKLNSKPSKLRSQQTYIRIEYLDEINLSTPEIIRFESKWIEIKHLEHIWKLQILIEGPNTLQILCAHNQIERLDETILTSLRSFNSDVNKVLEC